MKQIDAVKERAVLTIIVAGVALVAGVLVGGVLLLLVWACLTQPGGRGLGLGLLAIALLEVGLPTYALARALAGTGGLIPALCALGLSGLLGWMLPGLAHGVANP